MTDADKFLAAIIAEPDDDLPRLVFADWLEEHGDPERAELIRIQCAAAREGRPDPPRAGDLLARNRDRWIVHAIPGSQMFRRGFVDFLHIAANDFLKYESIIETAAPIFGLRLSVAAGRTMALVRVAWLARLRRLDILNDGMGPRLREWFRQGAFPELHSLNLRNNRLWADYVAILAGLGEYIPKLERLDLSGNPLGDEGFAHLATAPDLGGLRELILRSDGIDIDYTIQASGMAAFARSTTLSQLRALNLAGQRIGDEGFQVLVNSPNARSLERLDVSRTTIGEAGSAWAEALVTSPHVGQLRELNFAAITIDRLAAEALADWPHLATGCTVRIEAPNWSKQARSAIEQSKYRDQIVISERDHP